ncbi:MAG: hypothetical protein EAS48_02885 [Chryseobacterium sp.]|nr:MAG: hypothetical protein EAS48_02885 [Chryseobacterium sp.]
MFRLLSGQTNIFSIPVYMMALLAFITFFNVLNLDSVNSISAAIAFAGTALGYLLFQTLALNYRTHLPLFLYTVLVFSFYSGHIGLPLSVCLLVSHLLLSILTATNDDLRQDSYLLCGALVGLCFAVFPQSWPLAPFVILHIIATGKRQMLDLLQFLFGGSLVIGGYFAIGYVLERTDTTERLIPYVSGQWTERYEAFWFLAPAVALLLYSVADHFANYSKKSPSSRFKYTFLLSYSVAMLTILVLYMETQYEMMLLIALPAAVILSRGLRFMPKEWLREGSFWLLLISLLSFRVYSFLNY